MTVETVETARYVRKPLYVDAVQVTAENFEAVAKWSMGDIMDNENFTPVGGHPIDPANQHIRIRVSNPQSPKQTRAYVGDWVLYTDRGYKIYAQKPFEDNFVLDTPSQ